MITSLLSELDHNNQWERHRGAWRCCQARVNTVRQYSTVGRVTSSSLWRIETLFWAHLPVHPDSFNLQLFFFFFFVTTSSFCTTLTSAFFVDVYFPMRLIIQNVLILNVLCVQIAPNSHTPILVSSATNLPGVKVIRWMVSGHANNLQTALDLDL